MLGLIHLVGAGFDFNATASATLPGASTAQTLVSGIMFYSLVFCLVGLVLSAGMWAVGAFSNNYTQSVNGKKGFLICAGAALAIGAAKQLVTYFYNSGTNVDGGKTK
jgi:hypothetical protein